MLPVLKKTSRFTDNPGALYDITWLRTTRLPLARFTPLVRVGVRLNDYNP